MTKANVAPTLLTQAAYARSRKERGLSGGTRVSVHHAVKSGRISAIGDDKLIDPKVADIQWEQNSRGRAVGINVSQTPATSGANQAQAALLQPEQGQDANPVGKIDPVAPVVPDAPGGYADSRARRERAEALQAEMKAEQMAGALVDKDSVTRAVRDAFQALRDRVMAVPRRSAPGVVGMPDVRQIELKITADLRAAFEGYEQQMLDTIQSRVQ